MRPIDDERNQGRFTTVTSDDDSLRELSKQKCTETPR